MYTTISIHSVNPGKVEGAIDTFKKNTAMGKKIKGFVSRQILVSEKDPQKVTTITTWKTREDLEAWMKNPNRPQSPPGSYSKVDTDSYKAVEVPQGLMKPSEHPRRFCWAIVTKRV